MVIVNACTATLCFAERSVGLDLPWLRRSQISCPKNSLMQYSNQFKLEPTGSNQLKPQVPRRRLPPSSTAVVKSMSRQEGNYSARISPFFRNLFFVEDPLKDLPELAVLLSRNKIHPTAVGRRRRPARCGEKITTITITRGLL